MKSVQNRGDTRADRHAALAAQKALRRREAELLHNLQIGVRQACFRGIPTPVGVLPCWGSPQADAICQDLLGSPAPSSEADHGKGDTPVMLSPRDAGAVLRTHGDKGGVFVAGLLESKDADYWLVKPHKWAIHLIAYRDDEEYESYVTEYPRVLLGSHVSFRAARSTRPVTVPATLDDGRTIQLSGRTGRELQHAVALADVVVTREQCPMAEESRGPLTSAFLAGNLWQLYRSTPGAVAHALRILRQVSLEHEQFLTSVLQATPELRELAGQVAAALDAI